MRILVAPDKFKGSLGAAEAAASIAAGLRDVLPEADITILPVADGGEGTAIAIANARGGEWITCLSHDAMGRPIEARYCRIGKGETAVMEMSEAAGIWRLSPEQFDPERASTCGVGEMLLDVSRHGVEHIVVGLGGSATNDGGFGMARALGFEFLDGKGKALAESVPDLLRLEHVRVPKLQLPQITAAADVRAPLLGSWGATRVFAQQKGARLEQLPVLEAALARLAHVVAQDLGCDFRAESGSGAAGGLGFGLMSFCGAHIRSGFELVAEMIGLQAAVTAADVVITGEGRLDAQSAEGKAPAGVARLARSAGKPVYAIVGAADEDPTAVSLFDGISVLAIPPLSIAESMRRAAELLRRHAGALALRL